MSNPAFDGTSLAAAHIGDARANKLSAAIEPGTEPLKLTYSLGAEAGDVIRIGIQAQDRDDQNLAESVRLHARVYDADAIEAVAASWTLSEVAGEGSLVTNDAQAACILDTEADGSASLDLADVSTAYVGDVYVLFEFLDREGATFLATVTFA